MPDNETKLEYIQQGNTLLIVTRRPGQQSVRILADTVPPNSVAKSEQSSSDADESKNQPRR
jgi:hypothetical protein